MNKQLKKRLTNYRFWVVSPVVLLFLTLAFITMLLDWMVICIEKVNDAVEWFGDIFDRTLRFRKIIRWVESNERKGVK